MKQDVRIRKATTADAESIVRVHYAAVHETAGPFYPSNILTGWSSVPDEQRHQRIRKMLSESDQLFFVAEDKSGIIGFGVIVPSTTELRALYVHPQAGRKGIGKQILGELERAAILHGISALTLNASLNAEGFYRKQGYQSAGPGTHHLENGEKMKCVKMTKTLGSAQNLERI